jgi:hypothetical protein
VREPRFDIALQVRGGAALREKRGTGFALTRERSVIDFLEAPPAIKRHGR